MDRTPLPIDEAGNGARLRTLVFDEADAYMLARAMMLAANTAMMCDGPDAMRRLTHYRMQFMEMAPAEAALFRQNTDLCEIAIAMTDAPTCTTHRLLRRWSKEGWTVVIIGSRTWKTRDAVESETHERIVEMLRKVAPVTCAIEAGENGQNPW